MRPASFIIGFVFIISGMMKAVNVHSVANTVGLFCELLNMQGMYRYKLVLAVMLCSAEILLGMVAVSGRYVRMVSMIFPVVMAFFTSVTLKNFLSEEGQIESCGCFGEIIHLSPGATLIKNIVLLSFSLVLLLLSFRRKLPSVREQIVTAFRDRAILLYVFLAIVLPASSLLLLEPLGEKLFVPIYLFICVATFISLLFCEIKKTSKQP